MTKISMKPTSGNVCTRCGKPRIFKDSWQEKFESGQGKSVLTYSQFVCPDPECQKQVEIALAEKQVLAQERQDAQDKREQDRVIARTQASKRKNEQV